MTDTAGVPEQHQPEPHQPDRPRPRRADERMISATCRHHGRCRLRVTRRADGGIVLDPHAGFSCVITLPDAGGTGLLDALVELLRR